MQKRAFNPEDALAADKMWREAVQLALVVLVGAAAALTPFGTLRDVAAAIDCVVALPTLLALVVAWRTIGLKPQLLVYAVAFPALVALAIVNLSG